MSSTVRAAPRDASWYDNPDTHGLKVEHVDNGESNAVCNKSVILDTTYAYENASEVPYANRCSRAACKKAFKMADEQSDEG